MKISAEDKAIKEIISQENKFWQVDKEEVFKTSIAEYFGIEVLTPSKVATRLLNDKSWATESLKTCRESLVGAGRFSRRKLLAEIKDSEAELALIEQRLDVLRKTDRNHLLVFRDSYLGIRSEYNLGIKSEHLNDNSYSMMGIQEYKLILENTHKLQEIDEETYDDLDDNDKSEFGFLGRKVVDYERKVRKYHIITMMLIIGALAFISKYEMNAPIYCFAVIVNFLILPPILKRYIKPD